MAYGEGYPKGALSNSVIESAAVCGMKAWLTYGVGRKLVEEQGGERQGGEAAQKGIRFHESFEKVFEAVMAEGVVVGARVATPDILGDLFGAVLEGLYGADWWVAMRLFSAAWDDTLEAGRRWGTEYKAPRMTGHWKKNWAGLEATLAEMAPERVELLIAWAGLFRTGLVSDKLFSPDCVVEALVAGMLGDQFLCGRLDHFNYGTGVLSDFKTGSKVYTEADVLSSNQLNLYKHLLDSHHGEDTVSSYRVISVEQGKYIQVGVSAQSESFQRWKARYEAMAAYARRVLRRKSVERVLDTSGVAAGQVWVIQCPCDVSAACPLL